jgi:hypothetical protein
LPRLSSPWLRAALLAALVAAFYGNSLGNDFVWDDRLTAAGAADLRSILPGQSQGYYRPVVMLTLRGDQLLWGGAAAGYHLTNIVCHTAVAWLLAALASASGFGIGAAFAAALVFAAHPVQTEAVTYISGRTDPLCALFALLSLHLWRRARHATDPLAVASGAAIILALLCKEAALAVPFVLLVRGAHPAERPPFPAIPILGALVWLGLWMGTTGPGLRLGGMLERLPAVGMAALGYLQLLLWPSHLHLERFTAVAGWSVAATAAVWLTLAALVVTLIWAARPVPGGPFWLALAAATYAPVSGVVPVYPAVADRVLFTPEHFLYLPLLGLAPFAMGAVAAWWPYRARQTAPLGLALLLAAWGAVVVDRNRDWRDEDTLYRHTLRYEPPTARIWFNLGNLRLHAGEPEDAARLYDAALARDPGDAAVHFNLGIARQRLGELTAAEAHYRRAIALDRGFGEAYRALAGLLASRGEQDAARRLWEQAEGVRR